MCGVSVLLDRIKGQTVSVTMLRHEIERHSVPNSMLFYGPDGSGKFLASLELARVINCRENGSDGCSCQSCNGIKRLISNDLFIISKSNLRNSFDLWSRYGVNEKNVHHLLYDLRRLVISISHEEHHRRQISKFEEFLGAPGEIINRFNDLIDLVYRLLDISEGKVITIDMIRAAQRFLSLRSGFGKYRILIIDGTENMNEEAQNSFLKVSEDTPEGALIILTALSKDLIRPTITSRCRVYRFISLKKEVQRAIIEEKYHSGVLDSTAVSLKGLKYDPSIMKDNFDKLVSNVTSSVVMNEIVDSVSSGGYTSGFFQYILDRVSERLDTLCRHSVEEIYTYENLIKKIAFARRSILYSNANREVTLIDFLLNNMKDVVKYC
jgi:DNA polymerase III delta prime subunit